MKELITVTASLAVYVDSLQSAFDRYGGLSRVEFDITYDNKRSLDIFVDMDVFDDYVKELSRSFAADSKVVRTPIVDESGWFMQTYEFETAHSMTVRVRAVTYEPDDERS